MSGNKNKEEKKQTAAAGGIERYLGLCRAAGGVITGSTLVLDAVRNKKAICVLVSSDATARTRKQIANKCAFYDVPWSAVTLDSTGLGRLVGKAAPCAVIGLTGRGPADVVVRTIRERKAAEAKAPASDDRASGLQE